VVALNDANQVVASDEVPPGWLHRLTGRSFRHSRESFLWTRARGRVFLDGYVLDREGEYFHAIDLNNRGCIIGTVNWKTGEVRRAVLLEPIPERWER
jgi:hypothetical protein